MDDDATFWLGIDLYDALERTDHREGDEESDIDLEGYLKAVLGDPSRDASDNKSLDLGNLTKSQVRAQVKAVKACIRIAINLVLYVNSLEPEMRKEPSKNAEIRKLEGQIGALKRNPKKRKKTKQLQRQLGAMSRAQIVWLGDATEREGEALRRQRGGGGPGTWTTRRAHFHYFWVGPRRDADGNPRKGTHRVHKWVAFKRRDLASVVASRARVHKFREDKT